jgi:hypothetical protein
LSVAITPVFQLFAAVISAKIFAHLCEFISGSSCNLLCAVKYATILSDNCSCGDGRYGLVDTYLEDEIEMRTRAEKSGRDQKSLERDIDRMWGKMTLYNCYQILTAKKKKNPLNVFMAAKEKAKEIVTQVAEKNRTFHWLIL